MPSTQPSASALSDNAILNIAYKRTWLRAVSFKSDEIIDFVRAIEEAIAALPTPVSEPNLPGYRAGFKQGYKEGHDEGVFDEAQRAQAVVAPASEPIDENGELFAACMVRHIDPKGTSKEVLDRIINWEVAVNAEYTPQPTIAPSVALQVWYGPMPESNGKTNWTAILHRGDVTRGITIDQSEYPDRVRYEADRMRWMIGEIADEPDILAYDADKHSGYVAPSVAPQGSWDCTECLGKGVIHDDGSTFTCPECNKNPTIAPSVAHRGGDAIQALIAKHAEQLASNPYAYFELAYTRYTGWMAWLCSNSRDDDPSRKVLAKGQGDTPEEACTNAIAAPESTEDVAAGDES